MNSPASLLLIAGAITAVLAGLVFWNWRRAVRGARPAIAETPGGVLALRRVAEPLAVVKIAVSPPATVRGAVGVETGRANDPPHPDPPAAATSVSETGMPVHVPEIAPPTSWQVTENAEPQERADEGSKPSEPTAPAAPATPPPTAGGTLPAEQPGDGQRHCGCPTAAADGEKPIELGAAARPDLAPTQPSTSTERFENEDPPALAAAGDAWPSDAADAMQAHGARPAEAMQGAPSDFAGPKGDTEAEPLAEAAPTDAAPPASADPQSPCDKGADTEGTAAPPSDGLEPEEELETGAGGCCGEEDAAGPEPSTTEPASGIEAKSPSGPQGDRPSQPAVHRDRRGKRRAVAPTTAPSPGPFGRASSIGPRPG